MLLQQHRGSSIVTAAAGMQCQCSSLRAWRCSSHLHLTATPTHATQPDTAAGTAAKLHALADTMQRVLRQD